MGHVGHELQEGITVMHRFVRRKGLPALCLFVGAMSAAASGCFPFEFLDDCERVLACPSSTTLGAGGSGGGGGETPAECIPSESGEPVSDKCGVFVAMSGKDTNEGTKESPVATLAKAIELAAEKGGRVYACAEMFEEGLVLDVAVEVYGGLECEKAWAYVGDEKKTTLTAEADAIPLVMKSGASDARIVDFAIHAADAVMEGGSSIAVLADGATAELVQCELVAGNGAKGSAGAPGDPNGMSAVNGAAGNSGANACSDLDGTPGPDAKLLGGDAVVNDCGASEVSVGGSGGEGNTLFGGGGDAGQTGTAGQAGIGEPAMGMMWSCTVNSGAGNPGSPGEVGMPGLGATGTGTLSTSGYAGTSGTAGTQGKAGQGGGGGGGAKGGMICPGGVAGSGASGGSGGAGGCGGLPGQGGGSGGASIALMSLNASVTLTDCTLTTGNGGDGGAGGDLQPGGAGGVSGFGGQGVGGSKAACDGGKGGAGGNGGPGGGGLGGPSLGIAFQGNPPERNGKTVVTPGAPGAGGPGGSVNVAMNAGEAGKAGEEQEFPE
jgi:hypothetical protein